MLVLISSGWPEASHLAFMHLMHLYRIGINYIKHFIKCFGFMNEKLYIIIDCIHKVLLIIINQHSFQTYYITVSCSSHLSCHKITAFCYHKCQKFLENTDIFVLFFIGRIILGILLYFLMHQCLYHLTLEFSFKKKLLIFAITTLILYYWF